MLAGWCAAGQSFPNGLSTSSVDPQADAVVIRDIRRRLDEVRSVEGRPTVALVLSGGGAKGAAEVGALRFIEELEIPVDFICGTSIGGLLGGMYAVGYRSAELTELFQNQDWGQMLTDRIPQRYIPIPTKRDRATYLLNFPFWEPVESADSTTLDKVRTLLRRQKSYDLEEPAEEVVVQGGVATLPSGYAFGLNVGNLISSLTVGYQDDISFSRLPIPFICVAGDVVSASAKYWGSGSLNTALRSTMSIPGLFDPVRTGDMILVDGGVRNNFPTDLARAVGADYIIGIDLSDAKADYDDINNIGAILGQFITMLGEDAFARNVGWSDVLIKPRIPEYNMLSFNRSAVDTMLVRGYDAAVAQRDALMAIRQKTGPARRNSPVRLATDIARTPVTLSSVEFEGLDAPSAFRMARLIELDTDVPLDKARIDEAMFTLQATGAFKSIRYSLYGGQQPYRLVFHCVPAPVHNVSLGLRADSEEGAALLFRFGLGTNRLSGSKLDLTARIGQTLKGTLHYSLDLGDLPTLNFSVTGARYRGRLGRQSNQLRYDVSYSSLREDFYVTGMSWTKLDLRAGASHKAYRLDPMTVFAQELTGLGTPLKADYIGTWLETAFYTFDAPYFPRSGVSLQVRADYDFVQPGNRSYSPVLSGMLDFKAAIPITSRFCFLPDLRLRSVSHFGEKAMDGLYHTTFAGGMLAGRYTEDQIPFFGINHVISLSDYLAGFTAEFRVNPLKRLYLSALTGVLLTDDHVGKLLADWRDDVFAIGVQAAYDTPVGPIRFVFHWSNIQNWGAGLSLGYDF